MSKNTVTVSIGQRAYAAQEPLPLNEWQEFRRLVGALLSDVVDGTVHVNGALGHGEWNGVPEVSATFVADVPTHSLSVVRAGLAFLKKAYGQDAIALTIGHTEFI
jgi:hypothetical protein